MFASAEGHVLFSVSLEFPLAIFPDFPLFYRNRTLPGEREGIFENILADKSWFITRWCKKEQQKWKFCILFPYCAVPLLSIYSFSFNSFIFSRYQTILTCQYISMWAVKYIRKPECNALVKVAKTRPALAI